jgi:hypothetical protein
MGAEENQHAMKGTHASSGPRRLVKVAAWGLCGLTLAATVANVVIAIVDPNAGGPEHLSPSGPSPNDRATAGYVPYAILSGIVFSAFAAVGAVVAARRPRNPVGWCLGTGALLWSLGVIASTVYWHMAFGRSDPPAGAEWVAWFGSWIFLPAFALLLSLVPLLFPTGAPPGPRWRVVMWAAAVAGGVATLSTALAPGSLQQADFPWVDNPVGIAVPALRTVADVSFAAVGVAALAGIVSLVARYRRARGIERLQLKWVAAAGCLLVAGGIGGSAADGWLGQDIGWIAILVGLLGVACAMGIALLRYRLYDFDVVVNRALVYGALTATLAGAYLSSVLLLQFALSGITGGSGLAVAASTLAAAALFRPARARIQAAVDHRFYRRRYDAQRTLEGFSARLRNEVDLTALNADLDAVVRETFQPAHVSLWLRAPQARP